MTDLTSAKVLADSINQSGFRLTTLEVTFPRFILAEFNTHRVFSRNSASSRAIPLAKQIEKVEREPFVPGQFPINRSGMQADAYFYPGDNGYDRSLDIWITASQRAVEQARRFLDLGIHKQIASRILEPFMWHTVIVSSTEWENFFNLRISAMAQPEIDAVATAMRWQLDHSNPKMIRHGWHLPLTGFEGDEDLTVEELCKVSAARCARVSYLTHDGQRDTEADIVLYDRLVYSKHFSPLEHVATPMTWTETQKGNFTSWKQLRHVVDKEQL